MAPVLLILGTLVNLAILNSDIVKQGLSISLSLVVNPPIPLCYRFKKSRQNLLFRNGLRYENQSKMLRARKRLTWNIAPSLKKKFDICRQQTTGISAFGASLPAFVVWKLFDMFLWNRERQPTRPPLIKPKASKARANRFDADNIIVQSPMTVKPFVWNFCPVWE